MVHCPKKAELWGNKKEGHLQANGDGERCVGLFVSGKNWCVCVCVDEWN